MPSSDSPLNSGAPPAVATGIFTVESLLPPRCGSPSICPITDTTRFLLRRYTEVEALIRTPRRQSRPPTTPPPPPRTFYSPLAPPPPPRGDTMSFGKKQIRTKFSWEKMLMDAQSQDCALRLYVGVEN